MRANSRPLDALFAGKMALSVFVSCIRFGTLVAIWDSLVVKYVRATQ